MSLSIRKIICGLLTTLGFFAGGCHKSKWVWETEEEYFKLPYWDQRVKAFHAIKHEPGSSTLFIGDSITEGFDLYRMFGDNTIVNMGIGGDFTSGVLMRLDIVKRLQPKKVFLMIGINDILKNVPMDLIKKRYAEIIATTRKESPATVLYIESNLPTCDLGGLEANTTVIGKVKELNSFLKTECETQGAHFIDLYSHFERDGELCPEYTYDGLHISESGYQVWSGLILDIVKN